MMYNLQKLKINCLNALKDFKVFRYGEYLYEFQKTYTMRNKSLSD